MGLKDYKYSIWIKPISYLLDLAVLNLGTYFLPIELNLTYPAMFHIYVSVVWVILSVVNQLYQVQRYSSITFIISLTLRHFLWFSLALYAYLGFFMENSVSRINMGVYLAFVLFLILVFKLLLRYLLIKYREIFGRNIRRVVVVGKNNQASQLAELFRHRKDFGFELVSQFDISKGKLDLEQLFHFVMSNRVDELYCSIKQLTNKQIESIIEFADINIKTVKFIPDNLNVLQKKLKFENYGYLPILALRTIPLERPVNAFLKRTFDVIFSAFVFVFLLSWLMPIIGLIIVIDSPGPIYFRQNRPGFLEEGFYCYKFRSMTANNNTEKSAVRNDPRITKVGKFLRRTSLDELPQFINVLIGQMSVVGPRPHLWRQNEEYGHTVRKYMVRHYVKPGITGLAQTKGFRGEIEKSEDIVNRTRYDVFYIENWSFLLDLRIIIQTVINVIKGEDKAY